MIHLTPITSKNYIQFEVSGRVFCDSIHGDIVTDIFNRTMMNIYLEKYDQQNNLKVRYDDLVLISVYENHDNVITGLPARLRELHMMSSICTELHLSQENQDNLEVICLDKTNLVRLPDLSHCVKLKLVKINHSNLQHFCDNGHPLPKSLLEINLSGNNLTCENTQFAAFDPLLPPTITTNKNYKYNKFKLNLNDNHFKFERVPTNITNNFLLLRQGTYKHSRISFQNVHEENIRQMVLNTSGGNILQGNGQTVHLSSINRSVHASILVMEKYIQDHKLTLIRNIPTGTFQGMVWQQTFGVDVRNFLQKECASEAKHSLTKKTYKELFLIIWTIICHHPSKADMIERLNVELLDSIGFCFTGKINRLINSMVGFLEGVKVSISYKEEIQMSIQTILSKFTLFLSREEGVKSKLCTNCITQKTDTCPFCQTNITDIKYILQVRKTYQDFMYEISELFCDIPHDIIVSEKITPEYQNSWLESFQDLYEEQFGKLIITNTDNPDIKYEILWNDDVQTQHYYNNPQKGMIENLDLCGHYENEKIILF
jgi:hypothetical protein